MRKLGRLLLDLLKNREARRRLAGCAAAATLLLAALPAWAAEHGGAPGHVNWWSWSREAPPVGWFIVDFIVFAWLVVRFAKKPVREAFARRHETIKRAIQEAQATRDQAASHYNEYKDKLARIEAEVATLLEGGRAEGRTERERIVESGRVYGQRLRQDADAVSRQEEDKARERLRREAAHRALDRAEELLRAEITKADQERLLEQAISELEHEVTHGTHHRRREKASEQPLGDVS